MKEINVRPSVLLAWSMANQEACMVGSRNIEPLHFLLAVLKMLDDAFVDQAQQMGIEQDAIRQIMGEIRECRGQVGLSDEEITRARRGVRNLLPSPVSAPVVQMLHRSAESRNLFQDAANMVNEAGENELRLIHFLMALKNNLPGEAAHLFPSQAGFHIATPVTSAIEKGDGQQSYKFRQAGEASLVEEMGRDLTRLAQEGQLPVVVGRHTEMVQVARYLMRTSKRNVILVGPAGVGKTAIVEGLAQRLCAENAPDFLKSLRIVQINLADLVAGTKYRGEMEERLKKLIDAAASNPNLVIFMDEIHMVMKSGSDSPMDIANILKPALTQDTFRCIGATTDEEFDRYIKADPAFLRRFQILRLREPSIDEAVLICQSWANRIEQIQQVRFEEGAVREAVELSARFIHNRALPDKAIDLLENSATHVKVSSLTFHAAAPSKEGELITRRLVRAMLEEQYGISIEGQDFLDLARIQSRLEGRIFGQDPAIQAVLRSLAALKNTRLGEPKPLAVYLFTGPTGVGKTYMAECLSQIIFPAENKDFLRINMNEFKHPADITKITGAGPGFIGHERQGVLFHFTENHPQGVILLDEIEKAHPEVQDYFLQIFDRAETTDNRGRNVDLRQYIFVLTANVTAAAGRTTAIGFLPNVTEAQRGQKEEQEFANALGQHFRSEFLARMDCVIQFSALSLEHYRQLFDQEFSELKSKIAIEYLIELTVDEATRNAICEAFSQQKEGARGFIRLFDQRVAGPIKEQVRQASPDSNVSLKWEEGKATLA